MRIIAFNTAEGWSRDVTMDIGCGVPRGASLGAGIPRDGCPGALSLASFGVHKVWGSGGLRVVPPVASGSDP